MGEEILARRVDDNPSGGHVIVDLALTLLPMLGPEPRLVGRHRQRRTQLDNAVGALGDLRTSPACGPRAHGIRVGINAHEPAVAAS